MVSIVLVSYSRPSLMIIALWTQFHVERPCGQRPFSIVSVITNLRMELFQALVYHCAVSPVLLHAAVLCWADVTVDHVTRQKLRAMTARSPTLGPAASQQLSRSKQSDYKGNISVDTCCHPATVAFYRVLRCLSSGIVTRTHIRYLFVSICISVAGCCRCMMIW